MPICAQTGRGRSSTLRRNEAASPRGWDMSMVDETSNLSSTMHEWCDTVIVTLNASSTVLARLLNLLMDTQCVGP
jgi:hypothetical protein